MMYGKHSGSKSVFSRQCENFIWRKQSGTSLPYVSQIHIEDDSFNTITYLSIVVTYTMQVLSISVLQGMFSQTW
jgi:hypothetical protein